jgi:regulator of replication initiation timing
MKEIFKIINYAIINLNNDIAESKRLNKYLWEKNQKLNDENKMLRNDLKELSEMYKELKNKK